MSDRPGRSFWIAAMCAGAAAATAAEVSVTLLLYSGPGLNRSLTTVLVVQAGALGAGLLSAPAPDRPDLPEAVRRQWLLALGAYAVAAAYSGLWTWSESARAAPLGQGLGLGLMAALPLFACGAVLGGMERSRIRERGGGLTSLGGAAFTGATLAFALTGPALPRALSPASLFLGCLILLSAGGLIWGGAEDRRLRVKLVAGSDSPWGGVRVEDRRVPAANLSARVMLEGEHVRAWVGAERPVVVPWDVALLRAWMPGREGGGRILLVGGGASHVPGVLNREMPQLSVHVVERNADVVDLARSHLETAFPVDDDAVGLRTGAIEDALLNMDESAYDLVLLDTTVVVATSAIAMPRSVSSVLHALLNTSGVLASGPGAAAEAVPVPAGWSTQRITRTRTNPSAMLRIPWPEPESVGISFRETIPSWIDDVEGFARDARAEPAP